jgi:hypothetical protein
MTKARDIADFKFRGTTQNATDEYSFMAFGQSIVGSNNVPNCAE